MNTALRINFILLLNFISIVLLFGQQPVISIRPRIFLDVNTKTALLSKKANGQKEWLALKAEADKYATSTVISWDPNTANVFGTAGQIFYSYCGSSWEDATLSLGMAHQMTKANSSDPNGNPTTYSNKLIDLADEIIRAYAQYPPSSSNGGINIFQFNSTYATRHLGKTVSVIYDWCYDELGTARKASLLHIMEDWFNFMRNPSNNVYQIQDHPTGNYYFGQVICSAYMGYALMGDSQYAQQMIDFSRQRVLGTQSSSLKASDLAHNYFKQSYTEGLPTTATQSYLGPSKYVAAPQIDGIPVQGWAYGGATNNYLIDYCFLVKSATTEIIADSLRSYFDKASEALVHANTPNRFQIDNSNDNGSFVGSVEDYSLALRLAAVSEGRAAGPYAQYFYSNWIQPVALTDFNIGYPAKNWEAMLYEKTRAATAFNYPPYYPIPSSNVFTSVPVNTGLHKFYMRKDWSATSSWCTLNLGVQAYDDHKHNNAGHFKIIRGDAHDGDDHLLIGANEMGNVGAFGKNGIEGPTNYADACSYSNTLYIDDFNDYDVQYQDYPATKGGQTSIGYDEPTHEEQNDNFSFFRADLTSAYFVSYASPDTSTRTLKYFHRSFLYLRNSDIYLVYDQILAKNSTNPAGQYKKHLRWHFLESPTINGNNITATKDNSKLFIHTVLPVSVAIGAVNESNNPDNTFGSAYNYQFNTYTWRAEVSVPTNPLKQDFLTVIQPGGLTATEMITKSIVTQQNNMEGSTVMVNGNSELVLFNRSPAKYPVPITIATYSFNGPANTSHTLCGMEPNQTYSVVYDSIKSTVTATQSASGNFTASPAGVVSFILHNVKANPDPGVNSFEGVYPNPNNGIVTLSLTNPNKETVSVEVFDAIGKRVINTSIDNNTGAQFKQSFDWTGLSKGVYVVRMSTTSSTKAVKMIIH